MKKGKLIGDQICAVRFDGCKRQSLKLQGRVSKNIKFRFSNEDGYYEHTIFEPKPDDFKRGETKFTNKNGAEEKIPQPSNVESMMLFFKHFIDAIVPEIGKQIDEGKAKLTAPNWDSLRELVFKISEKGKSRTTNIKLLKNKSGEAQFPGFFTAISREGKVYVRNNFIGEKITYTGYEASRITNESNLNLLNTESDLDLLLLCLNIE